MKTQAFKNSEIYNNPSSTLVTLIVLSMAVFTIANMVKGEFMKNNAQDYNLITTITEPAIAINGLANLNSVKSNENITAENISFSDAQMAKFNEYLAPAGEPTLQISNVALINFPEVTNEVTGDPFLSELQAMARAKTSEAILVYEFQLALKSFVEPETEEPLAIESWMTSDKCWSPCKGNSMAMAVTKKPGN